MQAVARAYRIGQTKDVLVIYLESVADPLNYEAPVDVRLFPVPCISFDVTFCCRLAYQQGRCMSTRSRVW